MRYTFPSLLFLMLTCLSSHIECRYQCCESNQSRKNSRHPRTLRNKEEDVLITTTACVQTRNRNDYNARVDFTYRYVFEYTSNNNNADVDTDTSDDDKIITLLILQSIEHAIATSVATTLVQCTTNDQYPLYAVDITPMLVTGGTNTTVTTSKHIVIPSSYIKNSTSDYVNDENEIYTCPLSKDSVTNSTVRPKTGKYTCITALGMTSILFSDGDSVPDRKTTNKTSSNNDNVTSPLVMDWTFVDTLIAATIEDDYYLNQFVLSNSILSDKNIQLIQTYYERSIGKNIILSPFNDDDPNFIPKGNDTNGTVKVAIIAAVLSFTFTIMVLSLILCYCRCYISKNCHRHHHQRHHSSTSNNQGRIQKRLRRQRPTLYSFEPLDDEVQYSDSNDLTLVPTGWMVMTGNHNNEMTESHHSSTLLKEDVEQPPSVARFVATAWSDLTSDSESIMSSLHLDRIDEVDEELGDYSYELHPCDMDVTDFEVSNTQTLSQTEDNIEVRLKDRAASRSMHAYPDCSSLDFVEDWKVLYPSSNDLALPDDMNVSTSTTVKDQYDTTLAMANLSIEISIDDEIIVSANDTDESEIDPFAVQANVVDDSFTFPSDDGSDSSQEVVHGEQFIKHRKPSSVQDHPGGHIYDADDFQSIEISIVWMDSEVLDGDNDDDEEGDVIMSEGQTTNSSSILGITMSQPTNDVTEDHDETPTQHQRHTKEQLGTVAVSSEPVISSLTDSEKFVLQDSTESTMFTNDDPDSFSSSNAYRSVLDQRASYPTIVDDSHTHSSSGSTTHGENNDDDDDDDDDGIEQTIDPPSNKSMIAHWARDVLLKLMSDSPKMLQCDQSNHERDFDSYQSNDDT